jgi:hypothetical protein
VGARERLARPLRWPVAASARLRPGPSTCRGAKCCGGLLAPGLEGWEARYRDATAGLRFELAAKALKAPVLFSPILRRLAMASGVGTIAVGESPVTPGAAAATIAP